MTLIVTIWDNIDWSREILEAEDTLEKQHAQWDLRTPNPSEDLRNEDDDDFMGQNWEGDCYDSEDDQAALEASWLKVSEWCQTASLAVELSTLYISDFSGQGGRGEGPSTVM